MSSADNLEAPQTRSSWLTIASLTDEQLANELAAESSSSPYYNDLAEERRRRESWRVSQKKPPSASGAEARPRDPVALAAILIAIIATFLALYAIVAVKH